MALIFPRLARNFIKNGYFPTDEDALERILTALDIDAGTLRIVDPCAGEGTALAEVARHLNECGAEVESLGVEFDAERAWHAKRLLTTVLHADVNDVFMAARAAGLLYLNPPYGHGVADGEQLHDGRRGKRLELDFLRQTLGWLAPGGVLVYIIPTHAYNDEIANLIARNFTRVSIWMAPEQKFKQTVLFGVKRATPGSNAQVAKSLAAVGAGERPPELPEAWTEEPYLVPASAAESRFSAVRINGPELAQELQQRGDGATLWSQFDQKFSKAQAARRPPLRELSSWHLALALAAGQIGGFVTSRYGRTLLIKGATYKDKKVTVEMEERKDGSFIETRIATDRFVPTIRAIDFTEGSPDYGRILTIR